MAKSGCNLSILARRICLTRGGLGGWTGRISGNFPPKDPPERGEKERRPGAKMSTKKDPQRFTASPLSGAIIRETSCSSYFRRYHSISGKITAFAL